MNIKMIILGISMFVVLYFLYKFLIGNKVVKSTNLRYGGAIDTYSYSALQIPNATRYCYYIWVHANVIDMSMANIFKVVNIKSDNTEETIFSLDIVNNTDLQVSVSTQTGVGSPTITSTNQSFLISKNFPIQSWEQVIISFDNMNMDTYINGKFVKTIQFNTTGTNGTIIGMPKQTDSKTSIKFSQGKAAADIDIRLFNRYDYPMDPQTAWNSYREDKNASDGSSDNYGLNMHLSTNNRRQSITLF